MPISHHHDQAPENAILVFLAIVILAACSNEPQKTLSVPTFAHQPPIKLNVASIDVISTYTAPGKPPNVEHEFFTPPEETLKRWAGDRLRALGRTGNARYTVINAAVTEKSLPKTEGLAGVFKKEPSERYTATVEAQLEIFDNTGRRLQLASARATRSRSLQEGATQQERELMWSELIEALMEDFDKEMERAIRQYAGPWLL